MSKSWKRFTQRQEMAQADLKRLRDPYLEEVACVKEYGYRTFINQVIDTIVPPDSPFRRTVDLLSGVNSRSPQRRGNCSPRLAKEFSFFSDPNVQALMALLKPIAVTLGLRVLRNALKKRFRLARLFF